MPPTLINWMSGAGWLSRPVTWPQPMRLTMPITPITPSISPATSIV